MILTLPVLIACGIAPTQARTFLAPLVAAMGRFGIDTPLSMAAFIAQANHESSALVHMEESLYYRDSTRVATIFRRAFDQNLDGILSPSEIEFAKNYVMQPKALACRAYANRMGNGDEASGDGWTFRGRGIGGLTGRDNYRRAGVGCQKPYEACPELVALPEDACLTFAWYWTANGCSGPAEARNIDAVTRKINPGMAGKNERRTLYAEALHAFKL